MNKLILRDTDYTFNASRGTITFTDTIELSDILVITNLTDNSIIYNFACEGYGGDISGKVLTLDFNVSSMSSSDKLQIIIYSNQSEGEISINAYLDVIEKNTRALNNIAELLTIQNELIKEMF